MKTIIEINKDCSQKMERAIESLAKEFTKVRTGRANPAILDNIRIDYYGQITPINKLANIGLADQMLTITPWEKKLLAEIEREIIKANIGLNPQNDGNIIRIPIAPLSEARRKEMVKMISRISEEHKTSLRNLRREANQFLKELEKEESISEDEISRANGDIQKITDDSIKQVDKLTSLKEKELLTD